MMLTEQQTKLAMDYAREQYPDYKGIMVLSTLELSPGEVMVTLSVMRAGYQHADWRPSCVIKGDVVRDITLADIELAEFIRSNMEQEDLK